MTEILNFMQNNPELTFIIAVIFAVVIIIITTVIGQTLLSIAKVVSGVKTNKNKKEEI